jgi:diguanylate cyclase (GGDEF)-like protein
VAVGVSLLVALSLGAVLMATTRVVTSRSLARASQELENARATISHTIASRTQSAAALAQLVTELPVFRAHMTNAQLVADAGTMDQLADGYRLQLKAQFCIVTNGRSRWIGTSGWPVAEVPPGALQASIQTAAAGGSGSAILAIRDRLFLLVSEPARFGDEILGTMTVGYALDDAVMQELAQVTRCQVSLVSGASLAASSLREHARTELSRRLDLAGRTNLSTRVSLGDTAYIAGTYPLLSDQKSNSTSHIILLQEWAPTQQSLDELQRQFLWAGLIIFGCALAAGLVLSRRMNQPLREIAAAAGDIAAGNWDRQVAVGGAAEAMTVAAAFNRMSTSLRAAQERLIHDAMHDHLTQLPNRTLFMERLERAISRRARHPEYVFAVLFVDLDRFKTVNDSLGHPAGDKLLLEIARRLAGTVRQNDIVSRPTDSQRQDPDPTLARLGGDEFTILAEDIRDPSDAVRIADRIKEALVAPISLNGQEVFTTVSVGIAVSTAGHRSGEDVVRDADIAMYRAKASGGDCCALFDSVMHDRAVERLQVETDLRRAIERHELRLYYQPIVSLGDGRLIGFEALLRWQHPEQGLLTPAVFLEIAEETGLMPRIDQWVLSAACNDARRWQTLYPSKTPISVSVNISAPGFGQPRFVWQVATTLQETGLDPHTLRLEITEGIAMADAERTATILNALKELGVRISLDDFGTGYSSLSYLQRFPVDTLKIDRSFVARMERDNECREIIRTILNLARTLRLDVIAEGAETAAQIDDLARLECAFGQGYFFSRPLPLDDLRARFGSDANPDALGSSGSGTVRVERSRYVISSPPAAVP